MARRHGVHASMLFKWRHRYRPSADTGAGFVPVVVEAPEPASEVAPGRMEIMLGDDVRVMVNATVHAPALAQMLAVVGRRRFRFRLVFGWVLPTATRVLSFEGCMRIK